MIDLRSVSAYVMFAFLLVIGNETLLKLRVKELIRRHWLERKADEFEELAFRDALTGLSNYRRFEQILPTAMRLAEESGKTLTLCMVDLNDFKMINDRHGHTAGDDALRGLAEVLMSVIGPDDEAFRLGGDEFAVLLSGSTAEQAEEICRNIAQYIKNNENIPKHMNVYCSFGIAQFSEKYRTPRQFWQVADRALYKSKEYKSDGVSITVV